MKRLTLLTMALLTPSCFSQSTTILQQPTLPSNSLLSPQSVFTILDDSSVIPATTNKASLATLASLSQKTLMPTQDETIGVNDPYFITVVGTDSGNGITVVPNKSCAITNGSASVNLLVTLTGIGGQVSVLPGQTLYCTWDGVSAHIPGITYVPPVDSAMSNSSQNPVRNSVIKAYVDAGILPVDTQMANSTNPVQNGVIKTYVDARSQVRDYDKVVLGTDNAATDTAAFAAALATLNSQGYGTLWFDNRLNLNSQHLLHGAISVRGLSSRAQIHISNKLFSLYWTHPEISAFHPISTGAITGSGVGVSFTAAAAGDSRIISENLVMSPGDWFVIWSDDDVVGAYPNSDTQKSGEMHRVFRRDNATVTADHTTDLFTETISGYKTTGSYGDMRNGWPVKFTSSLGDLPDPLVAGTRYYVVNYNNAKSWKVSATSGGAAISLNDNGSGTITCMSDVYPIADSLSDTYSANQKIRLLPILAASNSYNTSHVTVDNFRVIQDAGQSDQVSFVFELLNGLQLRNITYEKSPTAWGAGEMWFNFCSNVVVDGVVCEGTDDYDSSGSGGGIGSSYFCEIGLVNGFIFTNNFLSPTKHGVDVAVGWLLGSPPNEAAYGTGRGIVIANNVFHHESHEGGLDAVSTHGHGYGVVVEGNLIELGASSQATTGVLIRSRAAKVMNNVIRGRRGVAKGMIIQADDCLVQGNVFTELWKAIEADYTNENYAKVKIINNTFDTCGVTGSTDSVVTVKGDGTGNLVASNSFLRCHGPAIRVYNGTGGGQIINNHILDNQAGGSEFAIFFEDTGASQGWVVSGNEFVNHPQGLISFQGTGNNNRVMGNKAVNCTATSLLKFVAGSGHRVSGNDMGKGSGNTNFCDIGTTASGAVKFYGNIVDGYGPGSMGLTGTNAAAATTAYISENIAD